jgi:hypothetical protein
LNPSAGLKKFRGNRRLAHADVVSIRGEFRLERCECADVSHVTAMPSSVY